jgi:hypothetical protein
LTAVTARASVVAEAASVVNVFTTTERLAGSVGFGAGDTEIEAAEVGAGGDTKCGNATGGGCGGAGIREEAAIFVVGGGDSARRG